MLFYYYHPELRHSTWGFFLNQNLYIYNHKQCFSCTKNTLTHFSLSIAYSRRSDYGKAQIAVSRKNKEAQGGVGSESEGGSFSPLPLPLLLFIFSRCLTLRHIPTSKRCTKN